MLITFPIGLHVQIRNISHFNTVLYKLSKEEYTFKTFDVATFYMVVTTMVIRTLDDPT